MKALYLDDSINFTAQSVRTQFLLLTIAWWIGFPLSIFTQGHPGLTPIWITSILIATVLGCILLYRHWQLLQRHGARTTPWEAVAYGFIPFYCFYWWFVAYAGLAIDNNRALTQLQAQPRMSVTLAMTVCSLAIVASILAYFPIPAVLITLPYMVLGYLLLCQQMACILALLQALPKLNPYIHES